jgi:hypothetical protein
VSTGFEENKISFHKSGYIHSTDVYGQRYRDGLVGIPFENVTSFLFVLVVAPKNPLEMIELGTVDNQRDIQIHLPEDVSPFTLQFAIVRKGTKQLPLIPTEQNILGGYIMCEYDDKEFGLLLIITKVLKTKELDEVFWPPFSLVLKRVG